MADRDEIVRYTNDLLEIGQFKDYCPNGLQVEGKREIAKIVAGVTASIELIEGAVARNADLLLVHHGYFWRNESSTITGIKKKRIEQLLINKTNLCAYHLPLDAHAVYGNNVQLAQRLGLDIAGKYDGDLDIVFHGSLKKPMTAGQLGEHLTQQLQRQPLVVLPEQKEIKTLAWCSGGAQSYFEVLASRYAIDAYITGEVSESNYHISQETGVGFFAAGHHATERYGVQALGKHLADTFQLDYEYIELNNPI